MFIPLVKKHYKWSSGLEAGGAFVGMWIHCLGEKAQIPFCCFKGLSFMITCPVSSVTIPPPCTLERLEPCRSSLNSIIPSVASGQTCVFCPPRAPFLPAPLNSMCSFSCVLATGPLPWPAQEPLPLQCSSVLALSQHSRHWRLLVAFSPIMVLEHSDPHVVREKCLWGKCHESQEMQSQHAVL